ncbi:slipin family protein [Candidatus Sumerlaeota bacterium]|nr:slipin family protein [Candidatus Sumerlaeota bacterium]
MFIYRKIGKYERGLHFRNGEFVGVLEPGRHFIFDPFAEQKVDVTNVRRTGLVHEAIDVIVKSGKLGDRAMTLDLNDNERALVWIDGRFDSILSPGAYAHWTLFNEVKIEVVDIRDPRFEHPELRSILKWNGVATRLDVCNVDQGCVALYFKDGRYVATLDPGVYAFWKGSARVNVLPQDLREQAMDIAGQEIMTADRVTLRVNAVIAYRLVNPLKAVTEYGDARQALYREAQFALRAVIGTLELDALLMEKDAAAAKLENIVKNRASALGIEVGSLGVRDIILPGDMKELMNKVTEAKKAAEAALITRREETAGARSQANTAKIFEGNPTLMRMRELEALEKVAAKANLTVVLGEGSLTDRVVKMV